MCGSADGDERRSALPRSLRGVEQGRGLVRLRAEAQQHEAAAEQIERRAPVGEPGMRRAVPGPRRRLVGPRLVGRRRRAVRPADRRVLVAIAEMDAEREPFAAHRLGELAADFGARRRALRRVVGDIGMRAGREHAAQIAARLGDVAHADRPALDGVGIEQAVAAPAVEHGVELPGQIDRVADAGIHAEAAGRRHHVRGVAGDEDAAVAIASRRPARAASTAARSESRNRNRGRRRGGSPPRSLRSCIRAARRRR